MQENTPLLKYINYTIIALAFSLTVSKAGTSFFSILMILLWMFQMQWKTTFIQIKKSKFLLALFAFLLWSIISMLWASDTEFSFWFIKKYWHLFVIPIIYTSLRKEYISPTLFGFLAGVFISELFSYAIFFEFIHYKNILPSNPTPFMDHMNYSVYLSIASIILLNKLFFIDNIRMKFLYFIYFLLTTSSLFMNGGRTGQVIFIFVAFTTIILNMKHKLRALFISFILISSILTLSYMISPNFHNGMGRLFEDVSNIYNNSYIGSFGQRVSLWVIGINIFFDNPIIGTGIGDEVIQFNFYANHFNFTHYIDKNITSGFLDFHNSFIQYAVQLGTIGLVLFLMIFYFLLLLQFKTKEYQHLNLLFILIFTLQSTTLFTFHLNNPMILFSLFAGFFSAVSSLESKTK